MQTVTKIDIDIKKNKIERSALTEPDRRLTQYFALFGGLGLRLS